MTGFKFSVPFTSRVESPIIRIFQGRVHEYVGERIIDFTDEVISDGLRAQSIRSLQVPGRSASAVPCRCCAVLHGKGLKSISNVRLA